MIQNIQKMNCQMQWMIEFYGETVLWNAELARPGKVGKVIVHYTIIIVYEVVRLNLIKTFGRNSL